MKRQITIELVDSQGRGGMVGFTIDDDGKIEGRGAREGGRPGEVKMGVWREASKPLLDVANVIVTTRPVSEGPVALRTDVRTCARCGMNHDDLDFQPLARPIEISEGGPFHTHWAACPTNGDPILLVVWL